MEGVGYVIERGKKFNNNGITRDQFLRFLRARQFVPMQHMGYYRSMSAMSGLQEKTIRKITDNYNELFNYN